MPQTKKTSAKIRPEGKTVKSFRPNQQQILYSLLLVATFLVGYLLATVQLLKNPAGTAPSQAQVNNGNVAENQNEPVAPEPETVLVKVDESKGGAKTDEGKLKGEKDAKVKIVEFSDLECPFCARFYKDTLPQIISEYIDNGKVSLEYRHFPLSFHPQAKPLAIATECANEQGKFWEMHDKVFEKNAAGEIASASTDTYKQWASEIGVDTFAFNSCYDANQGEDIIEADTKLGSELGVSGTPTFFINGRQLVGAQPFASFKAIIDEELKK